MKASIGLVLAATAVVLPGCLFVPKTDLNAALAENRSLAEQNRVQLAEIENLQAHNHTLEDRVIRNEQGTGIGPGTHRASIGGSWTTTSASATGCISSSKTFRTAAGGFRPSRSTVGRAVAAISSLQFDPQTGVSKLDSDILFDSGEAELKPAAGELIDESVRVLNSPAAGELKLMVAGHTDNQAIVAGETRERYADNFHLSTARALAVAERMKRAGLPERRLGVAGFGPYQPIASNDTAARSAEEPPRRDLRHALGRAGRRLERFNAQCLRPRSAAVGPEAACGFATNRQSSPGRLRPTSATAAAATLPVRCGWRSWDGRRRAGGRAGRCHRRTPTLLPYLRSPTIG